MSFQIPEAKVGKLKSLLSSAIRDKSSSYRELARIAGSLISVALAVGPLSRLFTRQMHLAIECHSAWDHTLHFSSALLEKLRFWYCNIDSFNGYSFLIDGYFFLMLATSVSVVSRPPWMA